ncbi:glycoside hydrolase family 3 N-terminal domain-containing protein [Citromicrobium bathyomarinum]|uniref:glycoside hydrolase family 3 N-terminal domain-containing protein n=1 Tax=Citromicrobium bathyomarinum TaxID=72174 RepID=UPI00315A08E5
MRIMLRASLAAGAALMALTAPVAAPAMAQQVNVERPMADAPYWDSSRPVDERVEDLLQRMTLEEKVAQILTVWDSKADIQGEGDVFDPAKASKVYPNGIGQIARPSDRQGPSSPRVVPRRSIEDSIQYVIDAQKWAMENTRLGIPVLFHEESLHGLAAKDATAFPQAIGLASTWDPALIREINALIAEETRARGVHSVLSPVVDVARDPRWGRIEETFGEDPYLVGEMGVAAVEGLSGVGTDPKLGKGKVLATLKHMTGHGQPESGTNVGPAQISERTLREMFFPPFEQVVTRTPIEAVMASYNEIDGIPSHSNAWLLKDILRGEWGFKGAVVSDYYAIEDMARLHKIVPDYKAAGELAINSGVDVDLPEGHGFEQLAASVREGKVSMDTLDTAVRRFLRMKFNAGLFDDPWPDLAKAKTSNGPEGVALARKAAEESLVLLKNDGVLPLALPAAGAAKPTIAVIGPNADVARLGGYYGEPRKSVTPLEGIRALVGDRAKIVHSLGVEITKGDDDWWDDPVELGDPAENRKRIAAAVEAARSADTILLFIGDTEKTSREGWADSHLGDRTSLDLVGEQNELFTELKKLGKPIVAVLMNGRPPSYPTLAEEADAILETWYAGEQQGTAIADALFGKVNPGGKLPVTVARNVGQLPNFYNYKPSARRGYLFDEVTPLYPFGFGLSYTNFEMSAPTLSASTIKAGDPVTVTTTVTNTGDVAGDEVVQVYLRDEISSVTRPVKELSGFQRVTLQPGESRAVSIAIEPRSLMMWNRDMERVIEPGDFTIMVGPNSQDLQDVTLTVVP